MDDLISRQAAIDAMTKVYRRVSARDNIYSVCDLLIDSVKKMPPAQPEITRCKDCKHFDPIYTGGAGVCEHWHAKTENNVYCTYAERRTNG